MNDRIRVLEDDEIVTAADDALERGLNVLIVGRTRKDAQVLHAAIDDGFALDARRLWYAGIGQHLLGTSFDLVLIREWAAEVMDREWFETSVMTRLRPPRVS